MSVAGDTSRRTVFLIGAGALLLALGVRLANAPVAFAGDIPQISVLDDLYQFKRIAYTAANFPHVLDFDPERGESGAFCPWPPLYPFAAGAIARLFGATGAVDVLRVVVWIPPFLTALFIGVVAAVASARLGWAAGGVLAIALGLSPFLIAESSIGDIDHHFLEAPLIFGIVAATIASMRARDRRAAIVCGLWLGAALGAALFVRPALLVAAALAFAVLFFFTDGLAAACGFGVAAVAVCLYRLTRAPNYPDLQWFLGWSHAALLGAAAVASGVLYLRGRSPTNKVFALLCGVAVVLATPSAPGAILFGSEYISGNAWFRTIVEGQPMWSLSAGEFVWRFAGLSTGAIFVWLLAADAVRRRDALRGTIAIFGILYLLLTLANERYWSVSIPLLALAAIVYAVQLPPRLRGIALAAITLPVLIQFALWRRNPPEPPIGARELPWIRASNFLRSRNRDGRVLAPWSMGHVLDVIGRQRVIVDNFGIMSDEIAFDRAYDAFLTLDENALWRYCRQAGIRYVVLDNPLYGLQESSATLGLDRNKFIRTNDREEPIGVTRLAACTWWWRAYYERGAPSPWRGIFGRPFAHFRPVYADPQPSWNGTPMYRGPALVIWERTQ